MEPYQIRALHPGELPLLRTFLYEAVFLPDGANPLPRDIIDQPELAVYHEGFGRPGDHALVAQVGGKPAGMAWSRVFPGPEKGYGTVDAHTPELSVAVLKDYRGRGIGTALLEEMLRLLNERGYGQASLSVQKDNPAHHLYRRLGFSVRRESAADYIMVRPLC